VRAKKTEDQSNLAGGMSYEQVKDRTSSSVGTEEDGGVLFDETIAAYSMRRKTALEFLVAAVAESHSKAFRPYLQRPQWTTINADASATDSYQLAVTAELDEPLRVRLSPSPDYITSRSSYWDGSNAEQVMRRNLEFLHRALGTAVFRRVLREALEKLQDLLWGDVLMRQSFTTLGAAQFLRDLHAVSGLVERYVPDGSGALAALLDGAKLLNLPVESPDGAAVPSLKQASDRIFTDNAEAKRVLEELDIDTLTPANARQILQRRVENSE